MKIKTLLLAGCAVSALTLSCTSEKLGPQDNALAQKEFSITASTDQTKTVLDGVDVEWQSGDQIKVCFAGGWGHMYKFDLASFDGADAVFTGTIGEENVGGSIEWIEALLYPYQGDDYNQVYYGSNKLNGVTLPDQQTFVDGTFAPGANVAVAAHTTGTFSFYNVGALVAVTVQGSGISIAKATLSGNNNEVLAGKYDVAFTPSEPEPVLSNVSNAKTDIVLTAATPVDVTEAKTFVFVLAPTEFTAGFTVRFEDKDGVIYTKTSTKSRTLARGHKASLELTLDDSLISRDPWEVNVAGTYDITKTTGVCSKYDYCNSSAYSMVPTIYKSEDFPLYDAWNPAPTSKKFVVSMDNRYPTQYVAFDITSTEVSTGCYALDIQDRGGNGMETVADNNSYYNSADGSIFFDFAIPASSRAYCVLYEKPIDMSGTYSVVLSDSAAFPDADHQNPSGSFATKVWKSADLDTYNTTFSCSAANTANGQAYFINYKKTYADQILFFNLTRNAVAGKTGCYYLGNLQDRGNGGSDPVVDGGSYYDTVNKQIFFDFKVNGYFSKDAYCGTLTFVE